MKKSHNTLRNVVEPGGSSGSLHPVVRRADVGLVTRLVRVVDNNATGELMRDARIKAGLSVRELARRLKLSAPYVSDLELGRRKWTEAKIEKWAGILCAPNSQAH